MRTLLISDLHLGSSSRRDVLRDSERLDALLDALDDIDRLVLLGDVLELRQGPMRDALRTARPVLERLGDAVGGEGEVVLVPGNHDHQLLSAWLERRALDGAADELGLAAAVEWEPGDVLGEVTSWLGPARVRVSYPGVWLRDDVYATHGHYLDRHTTIPMFERLGAGAMARVVREPAAGPCRSEDYERVLAPIYAWIHAVAQRGGPEYGASSHGASARAWRALAASDGRRTLRRRALVASFPVVIAALNRAGLGPVGRDISGPELRRAALRAFAEVVRRLEIRADYVIFGHTHRAGPLPSDDASEWGAPPLPRLLNSGSWVHEPGFLGPRPDQSPYRAGFGVALSESGAPELANLLDPVSPPVRA